jgi:hypothetical protein
VLSLAVAALAGGALCWPARAGHNRLTEPRRRGMRTQVATARRSWAKRRCGLVLLPLAAGIGALLAGPGGSLAAAILAGTGTARWRAGQDRRAAATAATGLSAALGMLVAEQSHRLRREVMIFLEERWIKILGAMAEGVESEHQNNQENESADVSKNVFTYMLFRVFRDPALYPGW